MISLKIASIIAIAAFAAGSLFAPPVQQAIAAVIATDVQCTGCVGSSDLAGSAVTASKIKDGEVKTADLAGSAVTGAKIATGAVDSSDVKDESLAAVDISKAFISGGNKADGQDGWEPWCTTNCSGAWATHVTNIPNAKDGSVILVTVNYLSEPRSFPVCSVYDVWTEAFDIICTSGPHDGAWLDYIVINRPGV